MTRANPEPKHLLRMEVRARFVNTVEKLTPEVLTTLREEVLPLYENVYRRIEPSYPDDYLDDEVPEGMYRIVTYHENACVERALHQWGTQFNLDVHWVLRVARRTLSMWAANPGVYETCFAQDSTWEGPIEPFANLDDVFGFEFEHGGWDPRHSTWEVAKAEIQRRFEDEFTAYEARMKQWARDNGVELQGRQVTEAHLRWTVLRYVKGWTIPKILDTESAAMADPDKCPSESAVGEATRRVARLIELPVTSRTSSTVSVR